MKIETQPRDDHQLNMTVEIETERLEGAKHRAARKISERSKIPGFRPGKAPYDVVRRLHGDAAITEDAITLLVDEVYPQALKQAEVNPAGPGSLEKVESLEPPKFIFTVPLEPTVDLGDYRAIRLTYDWQAPGEDKVDEAIDDLRRMYSTTDTVDRPLQEGDFAIIDLVGAKTQAEADAAPVVERPGHPIFIRVDRVGAAHEKEDEWPFAGFSRRLIGMGVDESRKFTHAYDQDDPDPAGAADRVGAALSSSKGAANEDLRGLTVDFEVTLKSVRGVILPELNDEFARQVGSFESLSALRDVMRANLEQRSKVDYDNVYFNNLIEELKKGATIKYPPQALEHEIEHEIKHFEAHLAEQNLDLEAYLKMRAQDKEKFIAEDARPAAISRLERSLTLEEFTRIEKIKLSDERLEAVTRQTWAEMQGSAEFQKAMAGKSQPSKKMIEAITMESASRAITQLTLERLKEIALGQAAEIPTDESDIKSEAEEQASG
ncbi:MAG: trigger factor [Chloroflexi bacterium]|nr:trigger factor [Chloroflexota bacterium]